MKDTETKLAFIKARAEGKSYSTIQKELGIAKATCTSWEKAFKEEISQMKRANTEDLYTAYNMKREARIKALGDIIIKIDTAIEEKPIEEVPLDKLLELRLKYTRELKSEYIEYVDLETDDTLDGLLEQYNQLYTDSRAGKYSPAEIKAQLAILDGKLNTLYRLTEEADKDGKIEGLNNVDFTPYISPLIRHEKERKS